MTLLNPNTSKTHRSGHAPRSGDASLWALRLACLLLLTCALPAGSAIAANQLSQTAPTYRLGPGDRIKISCYGRPDLNTTLQVRADGSISMPLLGRFRTEGMDIVSLEKAIAEKLMAISGRKVQVNLQVTQRRPLYVIGYVNNPGSFPFRIGATVLNAVALAGGQFRAPAQVRGAVDVSRELTILGQARERLKRALIRKARLEAERNDSHTITVPRQLAKPGKSEEIARLLLAETRFMRRRSNALRDSIKGQDEIIALSNEQITALQGQYNNVKKQAALARDELKSISGLKTRGLATLTRITAISERAADYDANARLIQSRIAQTRQAMERSHIAKTNLRNQRKSKIEEQLIQTGAQIAQEELTIRKSQRLLHETTGLSIVSKGGAASTLSVSYEIIRRVNGRNRVIAAEELSELLPGDIVRVKARQD